jgi:hypothetical protein
MILLIIIFLISFIITGIIFRNTLPNAEPHFPFKNVDIIINSDICNNKCFHLHHWAWMLCLLVIIIGLNRFLGYKWNKFYNYLISAFLGTSLSEWLVFGNSIFIFDVPCFNNCAVIRK